MAGITALESEIFDFMEKSANPSRFPDEGGVDCCGEDGFGGGNRSAGRLVPFLFFLHSALHFTLLCLHLKRRERKKERMKMKKGGKTEERRGEKRE